MASYHVSNQIAILVQSFAATVWATLVVFVGPVSWLVLICFAYATLYGRIVLSAYLVWFFLDRNASETGGRRRKSWRQGKIWQLSRDYFPVRLVKTAELPPDRNYLFAAYPHGVVSVGLFTAFGTDALEFENLFPGIVPYFCVSSFLFRLPVLREFCLMQGITSVTENSLNWILSGSGKGKAAVVLVGGVKESKINRPGVYKIVLENRKGFCKVALKNGSSLVPVFSFGEPDLHEVFLPKKGSVWEVLQSRTDKFTKAMPPVFHGKKILNRRISVIPKKVPVTVLVGKPIGVERIVNPSQEQIDDLHRKFKEAIKALFNEEKHKYLENPQQDLIIV